MPRAISVLFVCSGNICRSPSAEAVMRARDELGLVTCDSCGFEQFHVGEPIDRRARQLLSERRIPCDTIRARQLNDEDFQAFDWILAMDKGHLARLQALAPKESRARIVLFLEKSNPDAEVRDPYYGARSDFQRMLEDIERGVQAWLEFFALPSS